MDYEKAKELACKDCNPSMQALRNCSGRGRPAMIPLNNIIYERCPRATQLEAFDARYAVNLYFHCKEFHIFPFGGGPAMQTEYLMQVFEYIEDIIAETKLRKAKASQTKP